MNDTDLQMISDWVDGTLPSDQRQAVDQHISQNTEWAEIAHDMRQLKRWSSCEVPALPAGAKHRLTEQWAKRRRYRFAQRAGAVLAAASLLLFWIWPKPVENLSLDPVLAQVSQAQQAYAEAVANLESLALTKLDHLPAEVATTYRDNLVIINQAIAQCEQVSRLNPSESGAYWAMARAYQAKIDLLEQVLRS